jgi:hypothetical protein
MMPTLLWRNMFVHWRILELEPCNYYINKLQTGFYRLGAL